MALPKTIPFGAPPIAQPKTIPFGQNPNQGALDIINNGFPKSTPTSVTKNFFSTLGNITTDVGHGLIDQLGGAGKDDINTALNDRSILGSAGHLVKGLAKSAWSDLTFIPKGIYDTVKDFGTEVVKPGQSNLSQDINNSMQNPSGGTGGILDKPNKLANAFLTGLSHTLPFLAIADATVNAPDNFNAKDQVNKVKTQLNKDIVEPVKSKAQGIVEDQQIKQAGEIDNQLGLNKNTKGAVAQRKANLKTGAKTPGQVLVENNIPLDQNTVPALDENITARQATKQALLHTEGKWGTLDDMAAEAKSNLRMSGTELDQARAIIDQELAAYKKQYTAKGQLTPEGKLQLPLDQIDKIKSQLARQAYKKGVTIADNITSQAKGSFADSLKTSIEQTSENPYVKQLNREEGDFINTKKAIDGKDLEQMKKSSLPTRLARKATGAVVGSVFGPGGAVIGLEMGDYIGELLSNRNIPSMIRQSIIDNLKETPEGETILEKANALINKRMQTQVETPQLPAPGQGETPNPTINLPDKTDSTLNAEANAREAESQFSPRTRILKPKGTSKITPLDQIFVGKGNIKGRFNK